MGPDMSASEMQTVRLFRSAKMRRKNDAKANDLQGGVSLVRFFTFNANLLENGARHSS